MIIDFNRNEIKKITSALENDLVLKDYLRVSERPQDDKGTGENRTQNMLYISLSSVLASNIDLIKANEIKNLLHPERHDFSDEDEAANAVNLKENVERVVNIDFKLTFNSKIYERILFVIKYFSVKNFFSKNYDKFLPAYDLMEIKSKEKTKIFLESLMKEFDRFASTIEDISYISDIDSIPNKYINYLAQLVGYQKDVDDSLFDFITFREFIKNIIEIYRIKGTPFSISLFFNFIGFSIEMNELWFDRRFYFSKENTERGEKDNTKFEFYLTKIKPSERVLNEMGAEDYDLAPPKSLQLFSSLAKEGKSLKELLGLEENSKLEKFTYFKTNILEIEATPYSSDIKITPIKQKLIQNYIDFLIPIFVQNFTNYNLLEPVKGGTFVETLYLFDLDRVFYEVWDAGKSYEAGDYVQINEGDVYLCLKDHKSEEEIGSEGVFSKKGNKPGKLEDSSSPWRSFWVLIGKTNALSEEDNPDFMFHIYSGYSPVRYEWDGGEPEAKGCQISSISNKGNFQKGEGGIYPSGFFNGVSETVNEWNHSKNTKENLEHLNLERADVLIPMREENFFKGKNYLENTFEEINILLNHNFSYLRGFGLRNSQAPLNSSGANISSISASRSEIILNNNDLELKEGDKIEVFSSSLKNRGEYNIVSVANGVNIKVNPPIKENQAAGGGFITLHQKDWCYEDFMLTLLGADEIRIERQTHA